MIDVDELRVLTESLPSSLPLSHCELLNRGRLCDPDNVPLDRPATNDPASKLLSVDTSGSIAHVIGPRAEKGRRAERKIRGKGS